HVIHPGSANNPLAEWRLQTSKLKTRKKGQAKMQLTGKKVIVLGERDGVQGTALSECVKAAGGDVVLNINQCFVSAAAGAMDVEDQATIKAKAEEVGQSNLVVLRGSPDPDAAEMYA